MQICCFGKLYHAQQTIQYTCSVSSNVLICTMIANQHYTVKDQSIQANNPDVKAQIQYGTNYFMAKRNTDNKFYLYCLQFIYLYISYNNHFMAKETWINNFTCPEENFFPFTYIIVVSDQMHYPTFRFHYFLMQIIYIKVRMILYV